MISKSKRENMIKRVVQILTLVWVSILFIGVPASAERMDSVDINGSEVAYQAEYEAYTEAASSDGAVVCEFTVANPTAGKTGALCRIVLPESQNVYLYMDAGDLAVMRYDGSEYKKFSVAYQLESDITYTLCVFQDGLAFFDGTHCYTYSGDFSGFTDVIAGWSDESNVFSTTLMKKASITTETEENDVSEETSSDTSDTSDTMETEESSLSDLYPPIWVILALVLGITSNLFALAALHSSNMALRSLRKSKSRTKTSSKPTAAQKQPNSQKSTSSKPQRKQPQPRRTSATKTNAPPSETANRPAPVQSSAPSDSRTPVKKQQLFDYQSTVSEPTAPEPTVSEPIAPEPTVSEPIAPEPTVPEPTAPDRSSPPVQPFDLYTDKIWRSNPIQFIPIRYGDPSYGYCTFQRGTNIDTDPFILLGDQIWLNPVRFHPIVEGQGVPISMIESVGISITFDFCLVGTGKRQVALSQDVEMVNFRPARVEKIAHGLMELVDRGIIVFEPIP